MMTDAEVQNRVLAVRRRHRLQETEEMIQKAGRTVAASLKEIHDERLYQDDYENFESYCAKRWGISRQRAYQIIEAQNIRTMLCDAAPELSATTDILSEGAIRELAKSPHPIKILKIVAEKKIKPTAKAIKLEIEPNQPKRSCPHCGMEL